MLWQCHCAELARMASCKTDFLCTLDKAGVFLNRVHWPLLTTYSLPFNLENKEIFGFYKIITRQPKYVSLIEIFHKAFDNELSIGHDILTCTVNNYIQILRT